MVSFWHINYPFQIGGISSLKFVPEFKVACRACSVVVDVNTNPGYLIVENMLSSPLLVELTNSNSHKNLKGKCDWWSETNAAKMENLSPNVSRNIVTLD